MASAIELGSAVESPQEGSKKRRGRPAMVGHFHGEHVPQHFMKVLFEPTMGVLPIPKAFVPFFGQIPGKVVVKTYTGCTWEMTTSFVDGRAVLDQGWHAFAIAHQLRVGFFLTFKRKASGEYRVAIFDYTCTKVMTNCEYHGDATARVVEELPV